jgi:hypothetical protein
MNKLVYSALALTLISVPGKASENEWSSLDQEIENLSSSLSAQANTGPRIGGWVISSFRWSSDDALQVVFDPDGGGPAPAETKDQAGFQLDTVRLEIEGDAGSDYSYKVSTELNSQTAVLLDAYARWKITDNINGTMGQFLQPFLRSSMISDNKLLFLERSVLGSAFFNHDLGVMFHGNIESIHWYAAGQNGIDGQGDDFLFTGRLEASLMGGEQPMVEGAYGSGESTNLTVGVAAADEGSVDKGLALAADAYLTAGPFGASAELVDLDDDIGDATPWDATASYMFTDMYEVAVRYEDLDDSDNTSAWHAGINRYVQGHDIKWQLQFASSDSDNNALEADQIGLGLAVSF